MRATPDGIIIQGESGAEYLLSRRYYLHEDPEAIVLNIPQNPSETSSNLNHFIDARYRHLPDSARGVCIYSSVKSLPLGDRIAGLALGLANDVKTARGIEQLARVVDLFQGQGWR